MAVTLAYAVGTDASWDDLYDFLDPERPGKRGPFRDRDAERRYDEVVRKLTFYFAGRGCREADDLAMETVYRVAARCAAVVISGPGDRIGYFYGVARNVLHEWLRKTAKRQPATGVDLTTLPAPEPESGRDKEALDRRIQRCLAKLPPGDKRLILSWYSGEGTAKIEHHRQLADELGKSPNALRIQVHRIRKLLEECMFEGMRPSARRGVRARR